MNIRPLKLAIVVSHPIQYFAPVYRALAKDPAIQLTVLFATRVGVDGYYDPGFGQQVKWDVPLIDGYRSVFLSSSTKVGGLQWRIVSELFRLRPDVVLFHGYSHPTNLLGILVAKLTGSQILMRGDTRVSSRNQKRNFKYRFKQWLFGRLDGFVTIGTLNRAYYRSFGVPKHKLYFAPFCVDNAAFDLGEKAASERSTLRAELGIADSKRVVLFVAKLVVQKRPQDLLAAFTQVGAKHPEAVLVFAGSGEQEHSLRSVVEEQRLDVRFLGFVNQSQLPALYAASDIFVLPSSAEAWGLVINEAMAAGLPVITTDDVGAAPDLIIGKATGEVFSPGDVQALVGILDAWFLTPSSSEEMGRNAKLLITKWDVHHCAQGIIAAAIKVKAGYKL